MLAKPVFRSTQVQLIAGLILLLTGSPICRSFKTLPAHAIR